MISQPSPRPPTRPGPQVPLHIPIDIPVQLPHLRLAVPVREHERADAGRDLAQQGAVEAVPLVVLAAGPVPVMQAEVDAAAAAVAAIRVIVVGGGGGGGGGENHLEERHGWLMRLGASFLILCFQVVRVPMITIDQSVGMSGSKGDSDSRHLYTVLRYVMSCE